MSSMVTDQIPDILLDTKLLHGEPDLVRVVVASGAIAAF